MRFDSSLTGKHGSTGTAIVFALRLLTPSGKVSLLGRVLLLLHGTSRLNGLFCFLFYLFERKCGEEGSLLQ